MSECDTLAAGRFSYCWHCLVLGNEEAQSCQCLWKGSLCLHLRGTKTTVVIIIGQHFLKLELKWVKRAFGKVLPMEIAT